MQQKWKILLICYVPAVREAQAIFLRQAQKHIEDFEIPLVSESTANIFNKKWKQGYLFVL